MPEFQLLRCSVALAGDRDQVVVRNRFSPIMFPELIVLQMIHGEDAVTDVHVVGSCEMSDAETWTRLLTIYGEDTVKLVFPGARPSLPRMDRSIPLCSQPYYIPEPTRPQGPDPVLRPLDQYTMGRKEQRRPAPRQLVESEPTDAEIEANAQGDEEPDPEFGREQELASAALDPGNLMASGRTAYAGQTAPATPPVLDAAMGSTDRKRTRTTNPRYANA